MHQIDCYDFQDQKNLQIESRAEQALTRADRVGDYRASVLARIVANSHGVTAQELFHHSRSRAPIALTRQLAMYMMHVVLGRSLTQVGQFFGRDRTTVSYACIRIEDMRDCDIFDSQITELEEQFDKVLTNKTSLDQSTLECPAND